MKLMGTPSRRARRLCLLVVLLASALRAPSVGGSPLKARSGNAPSETCNRGIFDTGIVFWTPDPEPFSLAIADFDNDGHLDLVFGSLENGNVTFYRGDGSGNFRAGAAFTAGTQVQSLAAADFNGDGNMDLVVAAAGAVTVYLGDGTGAFTAGASIPVFLSPILLATADLDGNGTPDVLVVTDQGTQETLYTFLNDGLGNFTSASGIAAGFQARGIVTADFNNDGHVDVALPVLGGALVLLGDGAGGFSSSVPYPIGSAATSLATADFNGDGAPDLVATGGGSTDAVAILMGTGSGTFGPATIYTVPSKPSFVSAGDYDGDGHADVAVVGVHSSDVAILRGDGTGHFSESPVRFAVGLPSAIGQADFNEDGHPDLVLPDDVNVSVLLGTGADLFQAPAIYTAGASDLAVAAADFNGDGVLDFATANPNTGDVSILSGDGTGRFGLPARYPAGATPWAVAAADFDGDGREDLAVANFSANAVSILLGNGDGSFRTPAAHAVGTNPDGVAVGDFNRDGNTDVAVANWQSQSVSILLGNGAGGFGPASSFTVQGNPRAVVVADFNGDGVPDIAVATEHGPDASVLLGVGDGTFGAPIPMTTAVGGVAIAAGDLNGDGHVDLAVGTTQGTVAVFMGNGTGNLAPYGVFLIGQFLGAVGIADVDGDGYPDIIATNSDFPGVEVLVGDGIGHFTPSFDFGSGGVPLSLVTGDFNADDRTDLGIAASTPGGVAVFLNESFVVLPHYLGPASVGTPYSVSFTAKGGVPLAYITLNGTPPPGLTFFGPDVLLSGTPTQAGDFHFQMTAMDIAGCMTTNHYTLSIRVPTSADVSVAPGAPFVGQPLTITARVTSSGGAPDGTVIFYVDGVPHGPVPVVGGVATLTLTLPPGAHRITAAYQGTGNFAVSTSPVVNSVVLAAAVPALGTPGLVILALSLMAVGFRLCRSSF